MTRTCKKCGHIGPAPADFSGRKLVCRRCQNAIARERRRARPQDDRAYKATYAREHAGEIRARNKAKHQRLRDEALAAYGGVCACCGEARREFLSFDHINNDGAAHRRADRRTLVWWLRQHGYPPGIQILCHNCNCSKGFYGECPHVRERAARAA